MRKNILFLVCLLVGISFCRAQGNYRVSGKISGISDGTLLLVRNDGPLLDTIATTLLKNGTFSFGGETDVPFGAMLMTVVSAVVLNRTLKREYPWLCPAVANGRRLQREYPGILKKTKQVFFHRQDRKRLHLFFSS